MWSGEQKRRPTSPPGSGAGVQQPLCVTYAGTLRRRPQNASGDVRRAERRGREICTALNRGAPPPVLSLNECRVLAKRSGCRQRRGRVPSEALLRRVAPSAGHRGSCRGRNPGSVRGASTGEGDTRRKKIRTPRGWPRPGRTRLKDNQRPKTRSRSNPKMRRRD